VPEPTLPGAPTEADPETDPQTDPAGGAAAVVAPPVTPAGPPVDPTADHPAEAPGPGQPSRRRWALAIGVIALLVVGVLIVALLARQGNVAAAAPRYLPATTVQYLDVRFDLPGDQRQEVAELLSRFPGFEDASTLELKADDTFDRLVGEATDGEASYTADIKPWFGGQVAMAVAGLPDIGSLITGGGQGGLELPLVGLISVKDATAAETAVGRVAAEAQAAGLTVVSADVEGHPTWTFSDDGATDAGDRSATVTLTNDMLVVGMDPDVVAESVQLGTQGGATLAGSQAFEEATAGLPAARLSTLYIDGTALRLAAGAAASVPGLEVVLAAVPESIAGALTVKDGAVVLTGRSVARDGASPLTEARSTLADRVPAATLAFAETRAVGAVVGSFLGGITSEQGTEAFGLPVETIEGLLGADLEDLFAWVGDVAIVGLADDGAPAAALVVAVTDQAAAQQRVEQLTAALQLAAISGGMTLTSSEAAGTTITTVTVSQDGRDVPLSFALGEGVFVLGYGEASVRTILTVTPETALAADAAYQATMAAAGPSTNAGSAYVDMSGLRAAIEPSVPAGQRDRYEQEVKPWLLPFDQLGAVVYQDGSAVVGQAIITTLQP
jgi:hypothetical protein